ncbi:MAG: DUF6268 family outer membrane beta-barrel protein [Planctomycetia bacterium]
MLLAAVCAAAVVFVGTDSAVAQSGGPLRRIAALGKPSIESAPDSVNVPPPSDKRPRRSSNLRADEPVVRARVLTPIDDEPSAARRDSRFPPPADAQYRPDRDARPADEAVVKTGAFDGLPTGSQIGSKKPYTVGRPEDDFFGEGLPPPDGEFGAALPELGEGINPTKPAHPWTLDYIFLLRAGVESPSTNVQMNEVGLRYEGKLPIGERGGFVFRPFFDALFLDGPGGPSPMLPGALYKAAVDLEANFQINEMFGLQAAITPGFWSDFKSVDGDSVRIPARVLATWKLSPTLFLAAGVAYTDNFYRNALPIGGVVWLPTERTKLEVGVPRVRYSYFFHSEVEFYVGGEYGGDTYNIRTNGENEDMRYRDIRLYVGSEVATYDRASFFVEAGAAVYRIFEFDVQPNRDIDPTFYLRLGTRF